MSKTAAKVVTAVPATSIDRTVVEAPPREVAMVPTALPTAPKPPAAAHALLTPAGLKGLTATELKAGLGEPTLLRVDGPAQLWQYTISGCVLHVFLYDDRGVFRVTHAEVRIDDPAVSSPPTCAEWKGNPQAGGRPSPGAPAPST
jgi:hypothetical protein